MTALAPFQLKSEAPHMLGNDDLDKLDVLDRDFPDAWDFAIEGGKWCAYALDTDLTLVADTFEELRFKLRSMYL